MLSARLFCRHLSSKTPKSPGAGSHKSPWMILRDEFQALKEGKITSTELAVPRETDIVVIGGGLIGSAVAYWLKQRNPKGFSLTVVERDPAYTRASSTLSVGGIRHQFSLPENVQLSQYTTEFLRNIKEHLSVLDMDPPDVQFNHQSYLFLREADDAQHLAESVKMQQELGAKVELMSRNQLARKFPWLNLNGIEVGSCGIEGEGWFDPWSLIHAFKQKNLSLGVKYVSGEVTGFKLHSYKIHGNDGITEKSQLVGADIKCEDGLYEMNFAICINCAGPWAGEVARMAHIGTGPELLNIPLPVEPRKRFVYVVHCPNGPGLETPFVIDPSNMYFRREGLGGYYVCGMPPLENEEPSVEDLNVDYDFFHEKIWPLMLKRVPGFESLKLKNAWAGYYDYNYVDQNLVIGNHPYHRNYFFANGLTGHGIQHAPAIGRALMEYIIDEEYKTIDLSRFSFLRFYDEEPLFEKNIV